MRILPRGGRVGGGGQVALQWRHSVDRIWVLPVLYPDGGYVDHVVVVVVDAFSGCGNRRRSEGC